jgi:hypothetical protein
MEHCVNTHFTRRFVVRWFLLFLSISLAACGADEGSPESENQGVDQSDASDTSDVSDASDTADVSDASDASDTGDTSDASDASDTGDTSDASDASDTGDASDASDTTDEPVDLSTLNLNGTLPAANLDPPEFVALNRDGTERTEANLIGQPTVLWFYPLADSPG